MPWSFKWSLSFSGEETTYKSYLDVYIEYNTKTDLLEELFEEVD
jgi:hypothetical protein